MKNIIFFWRSSASLPREWVRLRLNKFESLVLQDEGPCYLFIVEVLTLQNFRIPRHHLQNDFFVLTMNELVPSYFLDLIIISRKSHLVKIDNIDSYFIISISIWIGTIKTQSKICRGNWLTYMCSLDQIYWCKALLTVAFSLILICEVLSRYSLYSNICTGHFSKTI